MPQKQVVFPVVIANSVPITATYTGNPFSIQFMDRLCLKISVTGTIVGSIAVQASTQYNPTKYLKPAVDPATWDDMPLGLVNLVGAPQDYVVDMQMTAIPWIRIVLTYTSGSGNLTATVTAKES